MKKKKMQKELKRLKKIIRLQSKNIGIITDHLTVHDNALYQLDDLLDVWNNEDLSWVEG